MRTETKQKKLTGHWKKAFDPNFLGSWDMENGDLILTIDRAEMKEMQDIQKGVKVQKAVLVFREKVPPFVLNATNSEIISRIARSPRFEKWEGVKIQLYRTQVKAFGQMVDAIRVRDFAPKGKKSLPEERFLKMCDAIQKGNFEKIKAYDFDLTSEQIKILESL